ncbi:Uma2 family endonuclease [Roseomonas sp. CCTCC AB2023176]|uniref:Uma2 family endonuclease n=1 Tax=Roseomonas sp. CCTCC AB2023176 TaxID=3342640 RepID=UPI0035D6B767
MSAAFDMRPPMTPVEFLEWELHQEVRHESDGIQPFAMTAGTFAHTEIASRLFLALAIGLRGARCTVIRTDLQVRTARRERVRYPDIVVACSSIPRTSREVSDPVLIVEVRSESTTGIERGVKRAEYAELPSLRRDVILSQDEPLAAVCERETGFAEGLVRDALDLPEFRLSVPLADLHAAL